MIIKAEKSTYHIFALHYEFDPKRVEFCRQLKEKYGFQKFSFNTDFGAKRWVFSDIEIVDELVDGFPDIIIEPAAKAQIDANKLGTAVAASKAEQISIVQNKKDSDIQIKGINGELYPYQKVGVEFLIASGGRAIVADVPGLGKSLQALAYTSHIAHEQKQIRALIIAPASVKSSWVKEIKKWTSMSYVEINSKTKLHEITSDVQLWVINYDILKKHLDGLLKTRFDIIIGDESHLVKNPKAARTKALMAIAKSCPKVVLLSGTPLLSRPVEMYTLLNMIDPVQWRNWYDFTRRYCGGHQGRYGYEVGGATNTEELHERIKRHFIRRQKAEVLKQLPPKIRIEVPVTLSPEIQSEYDQVESDLVEYLFSQKNKSDAEVARSMQAEQLTRLNILRKLSAMGKIDAAAEIIESTIESGEKILIFTSFMEPLMALYEKFKDVGVMITGSTPIEERGQVVTKFQEDPNTKVFFGGIKSAGVGITLTAGQNVLFLDYAWNPADMIQAEDRIHRPGQTATSVNIYQLHAANTIDDKLLGLLKKKTQIIDKVIDGVGITTDDKKEMKLAFKDVVNDVLARHKKPAILDENQFKDLFEIN